MSEVSPEAGPHAPAIREVVTVERYSGITEPADDPAPAAPDPTPADRSRELAELGDYVRLLADRMGLKDWAIEVDDAGEGGCEAQLGWDEVEKSADISADDDYFRLSPERRRFVVVRELMQIHFRDAILSEENSYEAERRIRAGIIHAAAAWAPCLPLPLVGWMRRAPLRGAEKEGER